MLFMSQPGVLCNRKQETCLTLTRATGDDQQIGGLQAGQHFVEVDEACRHAVKFFGAFGEVIDAVVVFAQYGRDRLKVMFEAPFADIEDSLFRLIHHIVNIGPLVVGNRGDLIRRVDHLAADGMALHNAAHRIRR